MNFEKDLGKVGLTTAGTWSSNASYERLTVVTWRGRSFLSKITNKNVEPGTNSDVWQLIAEKGADGQGGSGGGTGTTDIGVARYSDGILYWTKNGVWLLDEYGNKVKAQGVDGKDGKDGKDGEGGGGGGSDTPSISKFKSYVFIRSQNAPVTPQGGSFDNPVPTGWSDGIPAGDLQVWTSSRWFYSDDSMTAQTSWSVPIATTDTAEIDFEFSSVESPGNPDTNKSYWHDPAREGDKWMAIQITRNGRPLGWSVIKIAGENGKDGKDGASFNLLGSYDTMEEAELANPDPNRNDVISVDGDFYIWDGEQWVPMGFGTTISMFLSSYQMTFRGNETSAKGNESQTIEVIAKRGTELLNATIGSITGLASNGMSVTLDDNGTDHASFTISVTDSLVTPSGQFTIPISAGGETHNLKCAWAIQFSGSQGRQGEDGDTGENGYNTVNLMLYKRVDTNPSASMPGSVTYTFSTDSITTPANGWQRTPPSNDGDPLWMVQGSASTREDEVTISSWNGPVKFVENGYPGKTMRGPSMWKENINYQGLGNSGEGFVDIVYLNGNYGTLYYCKQNHTAVQANKPGTSGGNSYWAETEVQDFLATKLFFADLAWIENLGVNALKIAKAGTTYGGFMPPQTQNEGNESTILWAGNSDATDAPFQVDRNGAVLATNANISGEINASSGEIGPYTISQDGIHYIDPSSSGYWVDIFKDYLALHKADSQGHSSFGVSTNRGASAPLLQLSETGRGVPALAIVNGFVTGFGLGIRHGGSSNMTLDSTDNVVIFNNSSARTITLSPYDGLDGHIVAIIHTTSATLTVSSSKPIVQILSNGTTEAYTSASGRPEVLLAIYSASTQKWYLSFLKSS